jgi:hypothetical protein
MLIYDARRTFNQLLLCPGWKKLALQARYPGGRSSSSSGEARKEFRIGSVAKMLKQVARRHPRILRAQTRTPLFEIIQSRALAPAAKRHAAAPEGFKSRRARIHLSTQCAL